VEQGAVCVVEFRRGRVGRDRLDIEHDRQTPSSGSAAKQFPMT
jgi:hypothetical protein